MFMKVLTSPEVPVCFLWISFRFDGWHYEKNMLGVTPPKTNSKFAPENRAFGPQRKLYSIPTIHFQVLLLLVSGRVGA